MNRQTLITGAVATLTALTFQHAAYAEPKHGKSLERGRYLLVVGGCNDCHTPGFAESGGKLEPKQWLTGSDVGFQGPWGVTYPGNLRTLVASLNEKEWLQHARNPMRPPMPSPSLMIMTDEDLKSIYRYIRHLGTAGTAAPDYVPPGQPVTTAVINFVPVKPL